MRIPKLGISNFRNIANATLDMQDISFCVIRGGNFQGKSSIGQALSVILTDTTDGLDPQGRGFVTKIKRGESKSVLTAHIQGKHLIERTTTLNTNTTGRTSRSQCLDDPEWHPLPFDNFLTRYKDALVVCMNTDFFASLGEKEQKNLLAKLVLPERYDFSKDKIEGVEKAIGAGVVNFEGEPFTVIALAYKKLYEERALVNRQVKEFVVPELIATIGNVDSASLKAKVEEIREQRTKLQKERDAAVAKANEIEVKRAKLQTKIENLRAKVEEGKAKLTSLGTSIITFVKDVEALRTTAAKADELQKLTDQQSTLQGGIKTLNQQIERWESISDKGATCPTCDQQIDNQKIASMIADTRQEIVAARKTISEIEEKIKALGDVKGATSTLAKHEQASREQKEVEARLIEIVTEGKSTRAELDALGEPVDATLSFNDPLSDLQTAEDNILAQLRPVIAAEERKKEIAAKKEQLTKLQAKAANVDTLVDYFGKDGIKAELLASHIGGFENKINEVLAAWGYKCHLSIEPYEFLVTNAKQDTMPVSELSGAEQRMFSAALQCAVARSANIGFVVVDEVDRLQPDIRPALNKNLYTMIQDRHLEQIFLIVADSSKEVPKLPGAAFWYVQDGNVTRLGKA